MPSAPRASKNASCGFTPTAYGATASTSPQQKRANACAACSRPRCASPRSSTGRRSGRGSRPTRSWLRLRSTASATRSPKRAVATACSAWSSCVIRRRTLARGADRSGAASRPPETCGGGRNLLAAADSRLELAAGGEARNRRGRNVHLLARVARVHALTCRAPLRRELAEPGERDLLPALQGLGDRVEKGVDRLCRVAPRQIGLRRD